MSVGVEINKILVSGCMNGRPIRFNETGVDFESEIWDRWESERRLIHFCPELAAGFGVPRPPAEIVGGDADAVLRGEATVLEDNGRDVTDLFVRGAELALRAALTQGCVAAILTDGSPTCGSTYTYDGTFKGGTIPGVGVATHLLRENGIAVFSEDQIEAADQYLRTLSTDRS
jgi:uncharacterized protein YbbK (DUF523 family)